MDQVELGDPLASGAQLYQGALQGRSEDLGLLAATGALLSQAQHLETGQ